MAVSTDSDPPLVRKTRLFGIGDREASRSHKASAGGLVKRSKVWKVSRTRIWAATASTISVRPWPTWQYQRLASASTYRLPRSSQTIEPLAFAILMNASVPAAGRENGCKNVGGLVIR